MITYLIYNTDLIDIADPKKKEMALAFIDDMAYIAIGCTFKETHRTPKNMMERENGALQWSNDHNSKFEVNKFALINFTHSKTHTCPPLVIQNTIVPTDHHCFLDLLVNQELSWKYHTSYTIAKGTEYVLQLR
jgi:hypothetical protein